MQYNKLSNMNKRGMDDVIKVALTLTKIRLLNLEPETN